MLITPAYAREQQRLHAVDPMFGAEGYLWGYQIAGIALLEGCDTILDYGCGKGTLRKHLGAAGLTVNEYDPGVSEKSALPEPADLVACLDVMEHIEPEYLEDVFNDLARVSKRFLFVVVSTKLSKRLMADGRDTHVSLHDDVWWAKAFADHGFTIKRTWNTGLRLWVALLTPQGR